MRINQVVAFMTVLLISDAEAVEVEQTVKDIDHLGSKACASCP